MSTLPSYEPDVSDLTPAAARTKLRVAFLNATACYVLSFLAVSWVYQGAQVMMARRVGVPSKWGLNGVRFALGDGGWRRDMVLGIYAAGPVLVLGLGTVAFALFWIWMRWERGLLKLLLLWLVLHSLNTVLGGLLADTVTQSGSWYVPNWLLSAGTWPSTVMGLVFGMVQLLLGFLLAVPFLQSQDSLTVLQLERRPQLVLYTIAGPWLVGSLLLALGKAPLLSVNEVLHYISLGLLLVPLSLGCLQEYYSEGEVQPNPSRVAWGLVLLAVGALVAWRLLLSHEAIA